MISLLSKIIIKIGHCITLPGLPQQNTTDLNTGLTDIYFLTVLETGSLRLRCQQGRFLPESSIPDSHVTNFSLCSYVVVCGCLGLSVVCLCVCVVLISFSYKDTSHIGLEPT